MKTFHFTANHGDAYGDLESDTVAHRFLCVDGHSRFFTSTVNVINAGRVLVVEGKCPPFTVEVGGKELLVDHNGRLPEWPPELCVSDYQIEKILTLRPKKAKG